MVVILLPSIIFTNKICAFIMIFTAYSRLIFHMRRQCQLDYMLEPSAISTMELFCKKASSQMFELLLNTLLRDINTEKNCQISSIFLCVDVIVSQKTKGFLTFSRGIEMPGILLKNSLWFRCFPVNFAKILRTPLDVCFCKSCLRLGRVR